MEKLYLIDGMALVFRAYHAMLQSNLRNSKGEPTYAVFGFINQLHSILKVDTPHNVIVAFDTHAPTFRHEMFEDYKANRDAFPEELEPQCKRIKEFLDLLGISRIEIPGYEADDIIGSIAKQYKDFRIVCVTSDKDYYQLVDDRINLMKPAKFKGTDFEIVGPEEVKARFGGTPDQVRDVLALIGDSADNIPGVKGIGDKTAVPLVQRFGSIDGIYNHIEEIESKSVKTKLIDGRENAYRALELVKIDTEMKLPEISTAVSGMKVTELVRFFAEMEFTDFKRKWFDLGIVNESEIPEISVPEAEQADKFDPKKVDYQLVDTEEKLIEIIRYLSEFKIISVDTETDSLDKMSCRLAGISLAAEKGRAFFIAVSDSKNVQASDEELFSPQNDSADSDNGNLRIPISRAAELLKPLLENPEIGKIGQNLKFDAVILRRHGIKISPIVFDSMIAAHILDPDQQLNMDALAKKYLNYEPIPIENYIGKKKSEFKPMTSFPPAEIKDYAAEDADVVLHFKDKFEPLINANNQTHLAREIEYPLVEVLTDMEFTGVKIDSDGLKEISASMNSELAEIRTNIFRESGYEFNIDSPKQIGELLFEKMMIPAEAFAKKTKTGYSTDVATLTKLQPFYPIADYILQYRLISKLKNTYIDTFPQMVNPETGRIHTNYNQAGTNTGRLSSNDPNLQNIPIRSGAGKEIRKAFIPGFPDYVILSADYSQIELRIMAYVSGDANLISAFNAGKDVHSATASLLYGIPIEEVTPDLRRTAKTVNFGIMYGLGGFGLAQRLGIPNREGSEIIKNYFEKYPGIKNYMDKTIAETESNGFAETLCGRRRYFPDINSKNRNIRSGAERAAINMPIQGTGSDMIKIAMLKVFNALNASKLRAKMLLQVHDELVFECHRDDVEELRSLVKIGMENALPLGDVPVIAETGIGANWLEAH